MRIIFKSKDFVLTPSIQEYIQKKLDGLEKFLKYFDKEIIKTEVEIGRDIKRQKSGEVFRAEINLSLGGRMFRVESVRDDLFTAIDEVRDDLEQEIKKFKNKKETIFIRGARSIAKKFRVSPLARFRDK